MVKDKSNNALIRFLILALLVWLSAGISQAADRCDPWAARIIAAEGQVEVIKLGEARWVRVGLEDALCAGDRLRVKQHSRATLRLPNETVLRLDQGTAVTFHEIEPDRLVWLKMLEGVIHFISRVPKTLNIDTPFVNAGIEGTEFVLRVDKRKTDLWVFEGQVRFSNPAGTLYIRSGEAAVAERGKAPQRRLVVKPRDAVQWALYYPPLIDYRKITPIGPNAAVIVKALEYYRTGNVTAALKELERVPVTQRDARHLNLRAGLLLSVGRINETRAEIDAALKQDPNDAYALALLSVIALAQNQKDEALKLAKQAAALDPQSSVAQVALSYAYQAAFDLDAALKSIERAVELVPEDALVHARQAELELSRGYLNRALKAAQGAVALDPDLARTQTILGFAYLTQIKTELAQAAFQKAIRLDASDPLAHLGLGLAKIREGDLKGGTHDLEHAASLDPNNSLVRSYLGKAYYEQKEGKLAARELATANELDPRDPTPYFYDAIRKQSMNRPVEALQDLQKSIELNDNRAVYRSRLLLDEDVAARSSRLGYIYRDLGFEQRALVEGWQSLSIDQTNYSAHRLLADTYSSLPLHEIARDSELLQSQLLQPININPVQPRLASDGLAFLDDVGPSNVGLNEYARLFSANGLRFHADVLGGSNSTFVDNLILSGIHDNISYSLGHFHSETDGFRVNHDDRQDITNAFVQASLSPKTTVLAEFRTTDRQSGDRFVTFFDRVNVVPTLRENLDQWSTRVGFRHNVSPSSILIGTYIHNNLEASLDLTSLDLSGSTDSINLIELRHIFQSNIFSITTGIGYLDGDTETFISEPQEGEPPERSDHLRHINGYVYGYLHYPQSLVTTLGLSVDSLEDVFISQDKENNPTQVNWKLGFTWTPFKNTTVRGAAFRTLKRPLVSSQTIEPTEVAGFNQFFDGFNGEDDRRYGIAIDHRVNSETYMGAEFSIRELNIPDPDVSSIDVEQDFARAYLYQALSDNWIFNAQYQFERSKSNELDFDMLPPLLFLRESTTHRVPVELRFYHPSGFFGRFRATYIDQHGEFFTEETVLPGSEQIVVVDATVGYRLPNRLGILSIEARNLFDEHFNHQEFDLGLSNSIAHDRVILGRFTFEF